MKYILKSFILYIFLSIFFPVMSETYNPYSLYYEMHFPLKFENIKILYTTNSGIYDYPIIVDYHDIIIFWDFKTLGIKQLDFYNFQSKEIIYKNIKPLDYRLGGGGLYYYFSQECNLYLYNYYDEEKWGNYKHKISFQNLESKEEFLNCKLKMAFEKKNKDIAVYNLNSNKIIVINLPDEIVFYKKRKEIQVTMEEKISQALIYTDEYGTKLIGIGLHGTIKFWGLHGLLSNSWVINTFKFNKFIDYYTCTNAGIIGEKEKKLLYIYDDNFILFDLKKIKIINEQPNLILKVSTLLILDNGQGLVGTHDGFIYLINLDSNSIYVLDSYELCPGKSIISISYNTTCPKDHEICYIFAANCDKYIRIFKIQNININGL